MVSKLQAQRLRLSLEGRYCRSVEVNGEKGRGKRLQLPLYALPPFHTLPDTALYHAFLAGQGVALLKPQAWEIPLHGGLLIPDAYMVFPWGLGYLEVDTGHYARGVVLEKLRRFSREADTLYWASPNRSRLSWVEKLAQAWRTPLIPLWLPPPGGYPPRGAP